MSRFMLLSILCAMISPLLGQDYSYENHNQVDYAPLQISLIQGIANDPGGGPVPKALILLFTESGHTLIAKTKTDPNGHFRLAHTSTGSYRLVVKAYGFCTANVPLLLEKRKMKRKLILHMEVGTLDRCSYGSLE